MDSLAVAPPFCADAAAWLQSKRTYELKSLDWRFRARGVLPVRAPIALVSVRGEPFGKALGRLVEHERNCDVI